MYYSSSPNRRKRWYRLLTIGQKKLIVLASLLGVALLAVVMILGVYGYRASQFNLEQVSSGLNASKLYDAERQEIGPISDESHRFVPRTEIPQHLVNAFVAREDDNFFEHNGVVFSSVLRSLVRNIMSMRYEQGASTITMQLTRNVFELTGKSLDRKLLETMIAYRIERRFDKYTILEQYLSRIYFGQNCYGVKAAARRYFDKEVKDLNLVECATLAGLVRAPSLFNPVRSMNSAMTVKAETLNRMLDCGMISQEECDAATAAPIVLQKGAAEGKLCGSYSVMWARREMDELASSLPEHSGGLYVVSSLNLNLQQYLELAVEDALRAVEQPGHYPAAWLKNMSPEVAKTTREAFAKLERPAGMKVRGQDNDLDGILQSCALVVDSRLNKRGKVLAMVGGRSAVDGRDRWKDTTMPGRAAAPLLFCCACLPGVEGKHIVARSSEVTGKSLGYDVVRSFYDSLNLGIELPGRDEELYLYNGMFKLPRLELARLLYCVQNEGWGYQFGMVNTIWNSNLQVIYNDEPEKAPEYICRQGAVAVSSLAPFHVSEGQPVTMNISLPDGGGQWVMVFRPRSVCVFVWMGYDSPTHPMAGKSEIRTLLNRAAMNLGREIFDKARSEFFRQHEAKKQQQKQQQAS